MADTSLVICPHCGKDVEVTQALTHELQEKYKKDLALAVKKAEEAASEKLKAESLVELTDLKKQLLEKEDKVREMREQELKLREEKRKIEEEKKDLAVEVQRRLDQERGQIEERAYRKASDDHRFKDLEKDKRLTDALKQVEELRAKMEQGSQQTQGEVLELDFEKLLRDSFAVDLIEPVEKGVRGADIRQSVKSPKGVVCGVILWEIKRTKAWKEEWIWKLKDDLRAEKSNIPVIITTVLPKEITNGLGYKDGVWITNFALALPLAQLLRKNLLDIGYQKAISQYKEEMSGQLYEYITSHEFRQQVEAMVEVYIQMKTQITKERVAYEKLWSERERQVTKLLTSTANIVGSIQGQVGQTAFQVKGLELLELDSGDI